MGAMAKSGTDLFSQKKHAGRSDRSGQQASNAGLPHSRDPIDQLAEEFVARYRQGERPSVSEYVRLHPELAGELQELIEALVLLEELGPGKKGPDAPPRQDARPGPAPDRLGEFRLIREVGRGGMGI